MYDLKKTDDFIPNSFTILHRDAQCYVFNKELYKAKPLKYNRRDFYKIMYVEGVIRYNYADKGITVKKPALVFSNPKIPYSCKVVTEGQNLYFTMFTEEFIRRQPHSIALQDSPLYKISADRIYYLEEDQQRYIIDIFKKMVQEYSSDYKHKFDVLRNYVSILEHEAMKMQPTNDFNDHRDANGRITEMFLMLLDRQFLIETPEHILELKSPAEYAKYLSVHVNTLNRAVKKVTGKTTTEHINDRIINEAKALLKNTNWNISEIAYRLGYEYPTYFTNMFKKQTGLTPTSLRQN